MFAALGVTHGEIVGPYAPDAETLHLWHLNETLVPAIDVGNGGTHLTALRNGATLGTPSAPGFGLALSTVDGGPSAESDAGRDAYLSARPLVSDENDNVLTTYAGLSGAFTYEAIVRIDFEPHRLSASNNAAGTGPGHSMPVLSLDADEDTNRVCTFQLVPGGLRTEQPEPLLEFINFTRGLTPQSIVARIPTTGPDAISAGNWYHVAVSYTGRPNQPDNLKLYWTRLDPNRTQASLLGTGRLLHNLPTGCSPDFALGQSGRQSPDAPHPSNNFVGLIDEVRVSSIARSSGQMMFGARAVAAASPALTESNPVAALASALPGSEEVSRHRWNAAAWCIAGALVVIAGFLGWLAFGLKRVLIATRLANVERSIRAASGVNLQPRPAGIADVQSGLPSASEAAPRLTPADGSHRPKPGVRPSFSATGEPREPRADNLDHQSAALEMANEGFHGVLRRVNLQDLIQMECLNQRSTILEITTSKLSGLIYMERGEILHATAGKYSGEKAFIKLFSLRGGEFNLRPFEAPAERTIQCHWIHLLLEAARQRDEDTVRITRDKLAFTRSTTNTEDILEMAAMLADHPQVTEILVCSNEGKTLYNSKCADHSGRARVCLELLRAARAAAALLPVGEFDQIEIIRPDSKTLIRGDQECQLLIGMEATAFA